MLPQLHVGDLIVGRAMGAYTWASASEFNFFPRATVVAVNRRAGRQRQRVMKRAPVAAATGVQPCRPLTWFPRSMPTSSTTPCNQAVRELEKRYDLRGTGARFELQDYVITLRAQNEFQLGQLLDILRLRLAARRIDVRCLELGEVQQNLAEARRTITVRAGHRAGRGQEADRRPQGARSSRSRPRSTTTSCASRARSATSCRRRSRCCARAMASLPLQYENFRD